ncbi:hypothetical protein GQ53DRAFT_188353 [Thozetella sp. PMI_491]|nr:hypothetical protein GQ53DRAFT_188353 [Thozetella sp. PMI_491]
MACRQKLNKTCPSAVQPVCLRLSLSMDKVTAYKRYFGIGSVQALITLPAATAVSLISTIPPLPLLPKCIQE